MKSFIHIVLFFLFVNSSVIVSARRNEKLLIDNSYLNDTVPKDGEPGTPIGDPKAGDPNTTNILSPLFAFNFTGNKKGLSNLTPAIDYGFNISVPLNKKKVGDLPQAEFVFAVNPYVAGQINVEDLNTYVPGLMLPGNAGLRIDMFWNVRFGSCMISWFPINFGYKVISNFTDSSKTIFQHNVRTGLAFTLSDKFVFGIQHTWGWHNSTSESENTFKDILKKDNSALSYILISAQIQLNNQNSNSPNYLYAEWRSVTNISEWKDFPNTKIFTLGLKKKISFAAAAPAKAPKFHPIL